MCTRSAVPSFGATAREQENSRYVFLSERGAPMGPPGFRRMVGRLGVAENYLPTSRTLRCCTRQRPLTSASEI